MNNQRSTQDQVTELLKLAREHGLYDAEDYVRGLIRYDAEAPTGQQFRDWADRVEAEWKAIREALQWYVDHDETNDTPDNEPFLEGRRRALKALGLDE